ncbi:MAG: hypothetical protein MAG551_01922 [Candidatus Scalindua arabica]|uniref:Uncharacterized protein n=1 Tax=Candidatus Scalindua arabica TaxID=1127984 RepID=A0A941W416_9BACT|nr:hypothetical protein [Candidatus Scalindua arabica]
MAGKFKSIVMFVAVVSIFCFALNIAGITSPLYACDACPSKTKGYSHDKGSHSCASKAKQCASGKSSYSSCCKEKSKCDKGGSNCISELLKLARCAKKELLKEKIKANLEKRSGAKLDKVADLLVDAMIEEHKDAGVDKGRRAALQANIRAVFTETTEK